MYKVYCGNSLTVLKELQSESVNCCVTSPPYWGLRDYGVDGQLGLEQTPQEYVNNMVEVFKEVKRVLKDDGTLWLNLGDSYAANRTYQVTPTKHKSLDFGNSNASKVPDGLKPKDLVGIPWRVAFALQADGWYLRSDIIWHKPNAMPESVKDRPAKAHEYIFLFSKSERYYYDSDSIREPYSEKSLSRYNSEFRKDIPSAQATKNPAVGCGKIQPNPKGRNKRSVWTVTTKPYKEAHFAVFPPALIRPCVLAGCPKGGIVLDPFAGSGTTIMVAEQEYRNGVGIELNPEYIKLIETRMSSLSGGGLFDPQVA